MKCGHLFNGISGFGLAASWMGWENIMHCEIDPFCNRVMNFHFPKSYQHEDIRTTDFTIWRGKIDLLTGGFPCQPFSSSGKRKGIADDRHLWPEMLRAIREIQPRWIVGENVRGFVNWNRGMVFDQAQAELEAEGYEIIPFLLPACGVDAPHERYRIWPVAYSTRQRFTEKGQGFSGQKKRTARDGHERFITNTECGRQPGSGWTFNPGGTEKDGDWKASWSDDDGRWPTQSPICAGDDGLSAGLVDITFSKWREESLKALGNSIVPQVAYELFKAIEQYEMI